jgi:hypothetical protein
MHATCHCLLYSQPSRRADKACIGLRGAKSRAWSAVSLGTAAPTANRSTRLRRLGLPKLNADCVYLAADALGNLAQFAFLIGHSLLDGGNPPISSTEISSAEMPDFVAVEISVLGGFFSTPRPPESARHTMVCTRPRPRGWLGQSSGQVAAPTGRRGRTGGGCNTERRGVTGRDMLNAASYRLKRAFGRAESGFW